MALILAVAGGACSTEASTPQASCSADLDNDPGNCGSCNHACTAPEGVAVSCVMGACTLDCPRGYWDCDADPANGCETALPACRAVRLTTAAGSHFLVDATHAYWRGENDEIYRSELTTGLVATREVVAMVYTEMKTEDPRRQIAQDRRYLYAAGSLQRYGTEGIYRVSKADGSTMEIYPYATHFVLFAGDLVTVGRSPLQDYQLERTSVETGELVETVRLDGGSLELVAVDDSAAYVVTQKPGTSDDRLLRLDLDGASSVELATLPHWNSVGNVARSFLCDGEHIYFDQDTHGPLLRVSMDTGETTTASTYELSRVGLVGRFLLAPGGVGPADSNTVVIVDSHDPAATPVPLVSLPPGITLGLTSIAHYGNRVYLGGMVTIAAP